MLKKIKLLSLSAAICVIAYGSAVYLFNDNAQRILNNAFKTIEDKSIFQPVKDRFEIKAFKFEVNFLSADKSNVLLSMRYNPLTSNAHLHYVSSIEEKISIKEGKEFSFKFDIEKPTYLMSIKLPRNLRGYENILDFLIDDKFYISDMNTATGNSTVTLSASQTGFDMPEILDAFPISLKIASDVHSAEFKREGHKVTYGADHAYQVDILIGKNLPQVIKGSSNSSLTLNAQAFMDAISAAIKAGKIESWTPEQKEKIANDIILFLKDMKVKYDVKDEKTIGSSADKIVQNILMNNLDNNQVLFSYTMAGTTTSKGRNEILRAVLIDDVQVNQLLSAADEAFNTKSATEKEKAKKELSDLLYNIIVAGDAVDYSACLNLAFKSKGAKTFLENGKTFVQSIESYQFPGEYELDVSFSSTIGKIFSLSVDGMLSYKDFTPHADLKITFNKESHKELLSFLESITSAAKGTSFHKTATAYFAIVQSLPYDAIFKPEKNPKTDKEENVLKIQF